MSSVNITGKFAKPVQNVEKHAALTDIKNTMYAKHARMIKQMTTTKEDQIRAEFEYSHMARFKPLTSTCFDRDEHGEYFEPSMYYYWNEYKACAESYEKKLAEKDEVITEITKRKDAYFLEMCEVIDKNEKLIEANKRNAMLVDALTEMQKQLQAACKKLDGSALTVEFDMLNFNISANSEAVAAREAAKLRANKGKEIA